MRRPERPRVVVIGGGFSGRNAARALRTVPVNVTVIDRTNHHLFQRLLYPGSVPPTSDARSPKRERPVAAQRG